MAAVAERASAARIVDVASARRATVVHPGGPPGAAEIALCSRARTAVDAPPFAANEPQQDALL